jgi:hypothetical protein
VILFLDFDGVLHQDAVFRPHNRPLELRAEGTLMMHSFILEKILSDFPAVDLVLSTSWVRELGYQRTLKKIPESLRQRVKGATWHKAMRQGGIDPFSYWNRFEQIHSHVRRNGIKQWIALDDLHSGEEGWPEEHRQHLVLCRHEIGIADPAVQAELRQKLRSICA